MTTPKTISIVIPVYSNEKSLNLLFEQLIIVEKKLEVKNLVTQLIFVDDGSKDNSLSLLLNIKKQRTKTTVVKLTKNFGAASCYKTGLQFVTGDAFIIFAADLQDPPELILEMVDEWMEGNKYIICERISRNDPWTSKIFSLIYYKLLRLLVIKDYPKGGYNVALLDKAFLPILLNSAKSAFTPILAFWVGYTPKVISYHRPARPHGKSSWTFAKKFSAFMDIFLGFSITPIRIVTSIGLIVSALSFLYGILIIIGSFLQKIPIQGFATLAVLITFLLGLIVLMLGVIGEYLWRIFDETNKRPESVIEEVWS